MRGSTAYLSMEYLPFDLSVNEFYTSSSHCCYRTIGGQSQQPLSHSVAGRFAAFGKQVAQAKEEKSEFYGSRTNSESYVPGFFRPS